MSATPVHEHRSPRSRNPPPPPDVLVFTDAAAGKVGELIREEANPKLKLRVFVSGGGCSGFQYGFTFDENDRGRRFLRREPRACSCSSIR